MLKVNGNISVKYGVGQYNGLFIGTRLGTEIIGNFSHWGYLKIDNGLIILTEKGKAFTERIEEKGLICYEVNDQVLPKYEEWQKANEER